MDFKYGIVVVTYNRLELLQECIDHCINQTICPSRIFVVDNNSTDGTKEYLDGLAEKQCVIDVIRLRENVGGAGGFYNGIVQAAKSDVNWIMLIDDDAILSYDCMEKMNPANCKQKSDAYACTVEVQGKIDTSHRRNLNSKISIAAYRNIEFICQCATFCGLMIKTSLVKKIGFPEKDYFIGFDDIEYCLRINDSSSIVVRTDACLNHKTVIAATNGHVRAGWKEYYRVRNSIYTYKKHRKFYFLVRRCITAINVMIIKLMRGFADHRCFTEARIFGDAIADGLRGKLGKNKRYLP